MPINHLDIEMLDRSMSNLGNSFRQNRLDDQRVKQQQIEDELRRKMLDIDQSRWDATQKHQTAMETSAAAGKVDSWLQGDDGGVVHYSGTPDGLKTVIDGAKQQGKTLKILESPPTSKPQYGVFKTETPLGQFEFHMMKPEDVDIVMKKAKEIGGAKPSAQPGQSSTAKELETASVYRDKAATEADPTKKQQYLDYADVLEKRAKAQAVQPEDYETVKTKDEETGIERTRKVPIKAPTGKQITDKQGVKWLYKGTMADPSKDKNPDNWVRQ